MNDAQRRERAIAAIATFITNGADHSVKLAVRVRPDREGIPAETLFVLDTAKAIEKGASTVAATIYDQTQNWAEGMARETIFTIHHLGADDTQITGHLWRIDTTPMDSAGAMKFSGSTEGALATAQQHVHAVLALNLQSFELVVKGYKEIISMQAKRITELETTRDTLEKKARSTDDADTALAMATIEQENRSQLFSLGEKFLGILSKGKITMGDVQQAAQVATQVIEQNKAAKAAADATAPATPTTAGDAPADGAPKALEASNDSTARES